jgi:hypothetical protein
VNIRATLARAVEKGVISPDSARELLRLAKQTFYPERRLVDAVDRLWGEGSRAGEAKELRRFIEQGGYVDQKRLDALALLHRLADGTQPAPPSPTVSTNRSSFIVKLHHDLMCRPFTTSGPDLPVEEQVAREARLLGPTYRVLRRQARLMSMTHALARARGVVVTPEHVAGVFTDDDFGLGRVARSARWRREHDLDAAAAEGFVCRLATIRALLDTPPRRRTGRRGPAAGDRPYLLALMRIDDRYARWYRGTGPANARADREVVRRAERGTADELRLYRRSARLWRVIDEAVTAQGVASPNTLQALGDAFRRARGLLDGATARTWIRANGLSLDGFAALVGLDARLTLIGEASRTYTLGLPDGLEPMCWLHDAIRLGGFYPGLRRRVVAGARTEGRGCRPGALDLERALRGHWTGLGEPVPESLEVYARSLDFSDGGAELAGALYTNAALAGR